MYQATNLATHRRACSTESNPLDGYSGQYFSVLNSDSTYGLSSETLGRLNPSGQYPKVHDVQVGGGAGLAARNKSILLIDARGRWQADAADRIAQTADQLRGLKDAGIGDPFQFAEPNERVPMSAVRYWEDNIAAQGPVIDGHVTGVAVDEHGRTIMTIQPTDGSHPVKVEVDGNCVMCTGFPVERIPGTPRGQTPDKAIDQIKQALTEMVSGDPSHKAQAQKALHEIENLSGVEMEPGQRERDLSAARKSLKAHGLEDVVKGKAKGAYDMMVAGDKWNEVRAQHPDKVVLGDMANLESLDPKVTNKWIVGGPGGTGISAAEIILAKNDQAHVTMVGETPPDGLIENDQFLGVLRKHADPQTCALIERHGGIKITPGDGRFSLVLDIAVTTPSVDAHGKVHVQGNKGGATGPALAPDYVPEGYTAANNPLSGGGGYVSSIGREGQLPPIAAALKDSVEAQGGKMTMVPKFSDDGHYLGYELTAKDKNGAELRKIDVTGAASRFPPWELMDAPDTEVNRQRTLFRQASDLDAPPEGGNFDGGFVSSATQASRFARDKEKKVTTTTP